MPEKITCTHTVQVGSTLQRAVSSVIEVAAYDVVEVTIANGAADEEVDVQPGSDVQLLMITADRYDPPLTYKVNAAGNPSRALDQPQVFFGAGAISLLDAAAPSSLVVSNATGSDVVLSVIVGRNV
jgi:hypothetical protein